MIKLITLGADPEVFVTKDSNPFPSFGLIGGASKKNPKHLGNGFFVQEDNVMIEFNIPPSTTEDDFVRNIQGGITRILLELEGYGIDIVPSMQFTPELLVNPKAQEFGCEPDFNAYSGDEQGKPMFIDENLRFAGGHVHLGLEGSLSLADKQDIVKAMDLFLAVPAVLKDKDFLRRTAYGTAGRYREKPYGLEYRTLSNFWIASPDNIKWTYQNAHKAVMFVNENRAEIKKISDEVVECVNLSDEAAAEKLVKKYNIAV